MVPEVYHGVQPIVRRNDSEKQGQEKRILRPFERVSNLDPQPIHLGDSHHFSSSVLNR